MYVVKHAKQFWRVSVVSYKTFVPSGFAGQFPDVKHGTANPFCCCDAKRAVRSPTVSVLDYCASVLCIVYCVLCIVYCV